MRKKMGREHLVSLADRTTEEQHRIATMGGKASGEARRRKRTMREIFNAVRDEKIEVTYPDKRKAEIPFDEASVLAIYKKAMKGDVAAMKLIAVMLGEYEEKVAVKGDGVILMPEKDLAKLDKIAKK